MSLDADSCYRALTSRDGRFDGLFFVAVTTTGIYCRPICPARTPRRDRVRFFKLAAEAEKEGFRACFRCRPELAPGHASVDAVSRTARAALARIEAGALNDGGVPELARDLAMSERQLRRSLQRELGVSPGELAQTRRLLVAKQLLAETALPITEIAFAAGFQSLRRFNAAFLERFATSPSSARRGAAVGGDSITVRLGFRAPFAWRELLRFTGTHAMPGAEEVDGEVYRRTVRIGDRTGWIAVGPPDAHRGTLPIEISASLTRVLVPLLARIRALFDLDAEPARVEAHLGGDPTLAPRIAAHPGLRVPGGFDGFELAARAILGQQISVRGATTLAGRIVAAIGEPIVTPFPSLSRTSPDAASFARAGEETLARLGVMPARARSLVALARAVTDGLCLAPGADPDEARARLLAIPGVGPWTAEVVLMRAIRSPDAFPHADLGILRALGGAVPKAALAAAEAWRPWRSYAAQLLWEG